MKVVTHAELWAMPEGTIFSEWEMERQGGTLWRKDESYEDNRCFFAIPITATVDLSVSGDTPLLEWVASRFCAFESAEKFVIYEPADLEIMAEMLGFKASSVADISSQNQESS